MFLYLDLSDATLSDAAITNVATAPWAVSGNWFNLDRLSTTAYPNPTTIIPLNSAGSAVRLIQSIALVCNLGLLFCLVFEIAFTSSLVFLLIVIPFKCYYSNHYTDYVLNVKSNVK